MGDTRERGHVADARRDPRPRARSTSRREQDHVRARRPARAERPTARRHRRRVPLDGGRRARGPACARAERHRAHGNRPRSQRSAYSRRRRPALPRNGALLRRALARGSHDDAEYRVDTSEPRHRSRARDRDALEARTRPRPDARGLVRELAVRRLRERFGLAIDAARSLASDRSRPYRLRVHARSRRAFVVDALHTGRAGHVDPHRRRRVHRARCPNAIRGMDRERPRTRVAHTRRLRLPPHHAVPADPSHAVGSSSA